MTDVAEIATRAERGDDAGELLRWADMAHDDAAVIACGERWKQIAAVIGCTVHGFDDDFSASFFTPDGNVIQVGPKFRAALKETGNAE